MSGQHQWEGCGLYRPGGDSSGSGVGLVRDIFLHGYSWGKGEGQERLEREIENRLPGEKVGEKERMRGKEVCLCV